MTRTVQGYIDETPRWADGTGVDCAPMTRMQWRIWPLAAAGKFFEGMVVFMTRGALPLIGRFRITGSAPWLLAQGRTDAAETATLRLLERSPPYPTKITLVRDGIDPQLRGHSDGSRFSDLFNRRHRRATILAAIPGFCRTSEHTVSVSSHHSFSPHPSATIRSTPTCLPT